jgi:membrane fusion protein (multidrug efflux system)
MLVFAVVACGGGSGDDGPTPPRGVAVAGYEVKPQDLSREVSRAGSVEPLRVVRIAPQMAGNLLEMRVQEGDQVQAGDILARLDIREHRAQLNRSDSLLAQARSIYERTSDLFGRGAISRAEYDQALADYEVAQSEVELWQTRVDFGEIRAEIDGTITARMADRGDAVAANEVILELADLSTLVVRLGVSDRDVGGIVTGAPIPLSMDAQPNEQIISVVRRVFPAADPDSRLVPVELEITTVPDGVQVRPGYLVRAALTVDARADVLAIPGEALLALEGDQRWVYRIVENRLQRQDVVTGVERRNWSEVISGLSAGDVIVGTNPANFREDLLVRVT